jgi:DNA-directed RNA polymerase II subunit RPB1
MSIRGKDLLDRNDVEHIKGIQFSLFSHQDITKGSVCDIRTVDTYDGNVPKSNGLFDHNMGTIDPQIICPVDQKRSELCPGYFGKVDFALPVFNYNFMPYIEKLLKCVCFRCSTLLIDKNDPAIIKEVEGKKGYNRFIAICNLCMKNKNKKCMYNSGCMVFQPKYTRLNTAAMKEHDNIVKIRAEFTQNAFKDSKVQKEQIFTPEICYNIFKQIKDEDVDFLGFSSKYSRPEWMIITSLPIPPPNVRPSIRQSDNQRSEDDLSFALSMIIKTNKQLKSLIDNNGKEKSIDQYQGALQYHVATYMNNEIPGVPGTRQRSSYRPLKAIAQRLKGKEGRMRGNIMGKRVDYSARAVISVDPNINIDEFGVAQKIAMVLTFPEIVTPYNIRQMQKAVRNGPKNYPGAKSVTKHTTGNTFNLKHADVQKVAAELEMGDTVYRHLVDGDICLFNRQPTLHRMSMMGHKIKVLPGNTFRLNITDCDPYNADFDGDRHNIHFDSFFYGN